MATKTVYYSMNNINMSNEDNKHDTNYINKHKYTDTDTRKLHLWAWHVERAVSVFHDVRVTRTSLAQDVLESSFHPIFMHERLLPFYFDLSFPVFFHSSVLMHPEPHTDLDNLDTVQHNLRNSAKGSNDAYDVTVSLTGYEPNDMVFNELGNSQGSFSYVTPSSDLDIDDTALGKLLTEAHREYADYRSQEGVSVSQSSLSVVFDRTGKPVGERNVDQSIGFGVTRNTYSAHSKFSENTQAEKMVDRTGKPVGENSSNAQIRTLLDEQRQMIIAEYCEKIGHHELQAARAEEERRILQEEWRRQQKDFREVHQQSLTEM